MNSNLLSSTLLQSEAKLIPVRIRLTDQDGKNVVRSATANFKMCQQRKSAHTWGGTITLPQSIDYRGAECALARVLGFEPAFRVFTPDPDGDVAPGVHGGKTQAEAYETFIHQLAGK